MIKKVIGLYYSPVGGTRLMAEKIVSDLAGKLGEDCLDEVGFECYDLEGDNIQALDLDEECIAVIATPVYMGKMPLPAAKVLRGINGNGVMSLVSVTYGGRSYGNALYELQRCAEDAGFKVIGAGAFMIFCKSLLSERQFKAPSVDYESLAEFEDAVSGKLKRLSGSEVHSLKIKPAPVEAPGHMPVHLVSRYSTAAAAAAQKLCERLSVKKSHSEWFL